MPVLAFNVSSWGQKAIDSGVVLKELNALASRNA